MRTFGAPAQSLWRDKIIAAAHDVFMAATQRKDRLAAEFLLEGDPARVVATEAQVKWEAGVVSVAMSRPSERPPFEWELEITSDIGESDYFKHYLVREHDVVLAQRKLLTPIDQTEAELILADLAEARTAVQ